MIYKFIDDLGTFTVKEPQKYNLYLPLTNKDGSLLSSISANLAGDIKKDNEHFLTTPASIEDVRDNLLCRREFFIQAGQNLLRLSCPYDDVQEIGFIYQKLVKEALGLRMEIINFIPQNIAVEVMQVSLMNMTNTDLEIMSTSFIPLYGRAEKNLRDHRHVTSLLNRVELDKYGIILKPTMVFDENGHKENETIYFVLGYEDNTIAPVGQFPTLDYFCGKNDLLNPDAIGNIPAAISKLPEFDGKEACAAFRFSKRKLKPKETISYFLIMGISGNRQAIWDVFEQLNTPDKVKEAFSETKKYWQTYLGTLQFNFNNPDFNNWLLWVKLQPTLRKLFGCSFLPHFDYGKGGRGWRDLWQDALALLTNEPESAKQLILDNFKGVRLDGSNATVITKEGNFIADRNRISRVWMDHGVWPFLTLRSYIHKNADLDILLKDETYFRDGQLKRAKEMDLNFSSKDNLLRTKDKKIYKGTVLEHLLIENLVQFFNVGRHNCVKLENGDWNDGLDMASANGESATFSFMYAHNLAGLCLFLEKLKFKTKNIYLLKELRILLDRIYQPINYNNFREKQKRLKIYFEKTKNISGEKIKVSLDDLINDLSEKSKHMSKWLGEKEWLKLGFFNGYYDNNSQMVEGNIQSRLRMVLASQVFAIMSGVATEKQISEIWNSINKYLRDKETGGFRLNTDFGSLYLDLGRAFGFAYGDKENGAFFNHMVVMLSYALYSRGFIQEGFQTLNSIYEMTTSEKAQIYPMIPEYFNRQGNGLYLYLTGSSAWYIYTLLEEVIGIKFSFGDLILMPKLVPENFSRGNIEVKFKLNSKIIKVTFLRQNTNRGQYMIKEVWLEDKKIDKQNECFVIKRKDILAYAKAEVSIKVYLSDN
jgi:cellobiose phosphorylase